MHSNPRLPFIRLGRKPSPVSCSRSKAKRTSSETRSGKKCVFALTRIPRSRALRRLETGSRPRLWKEDGPAPFQNIKIFLLCQIDPLFSTSANPLNRCPEDDFSGSQFHPPGLSPDKDIPTCSQTLIVETVEDSLASETGRSSQAVDA